MIRVQNISKTYRQVAAVDRVSFEVAEGQTLCLIGSSGSGKTTTLKMLNRLIEPDAGQIEIENQDILTGSPVRLRRKIGYVIQQGGLFPHLTVARNVGLLLELEKWPAAKLKARVAELLELVNLPAATFARRYPQELSGGQQQRVGLARALALNPPIVLMDEPFGALDPITRTQVQDGFLEIQQQFGMTTVMVTHDMAEAFKFGDRIAIMDKGKVLQIGTPLDLIQQPVSDFVAEFVCAQAGLDQLMTLPVQKLAEPLNQEAPSPWQVNAAGQISGYRDAHGQIYTEIPRLKQGETLQTALKTFLGSPFEGLPVETNEGQLLGILQDQKLKKLL